MPRIKPGQQRKRMAFRNRAIYRNYGPSLDDGLDRGIVEECVPLWRDCSKRAGRTAVGVKHGNPTGRAHSTPSPDDVLASYGITFDRDPKLWAAYERAVRVEAVRRYDLKPRRGRPPKAAHDEGYA